MEFLTGLGLPRLSQSTEPRSHQDLNYRNVIFLDIIFIGPVWENKDMLIGWLYTPAVHYVLGMKTKTLFISH